MFASPAPQRANPAFGHGYHRNSTRPVICLRKNGREHSITLRPAITALLATLSIALLLGVLASGTYLIVRDDLLGATMARQARMQHAYEDRLASLRAQVDIVTSRQLLDQQAVETRVDRLIARQKSIGERERHVRAAMDRAKKLRALDAERLSKALSTGSVRPAIKTNGALKLGSLVGTRSPFGATGSPELAQPVMTASVSPDVDALEAVEESLARAEKSQIAKLDIARDTAINKAKKLARVLSNQGMSVPQKTGTGGPLIELKTGDQFLDSIHALEESLEQLSSLRAKANTLPHGSPTPGQSISSRFGSRVDPFTKRRAIHGGLDFRAASGVPVLATAGGTIVKAGRHGGYGKLVEVDHGNGLTTRYAHLSRIRVKKGQTIRRGSLVGNVGSTGRSTGPHLHYEVRRKGRTVDPLKYVRLGKKLTPLL